MRSIENKILAIGLVKEVLEEKINIVYYHCNKNGFFTFKEYDTTKE